MWVGESRWGRTKAISLCSPPLPALLEAAQQKCEERQRRQRRRRRRESCLAWLLQKERRRMQFSHHLCLKRLFFPKRTLPLAKGSEEERGRGERALLVFPKGSLTHLHMQIFVAKRPSPRQFLWDFQGLAFTSKVIKSYERKAFIF